LRWILNHLQYPIIGFGDLETVRDCYQKAVSAIPESSTTISSLAVLELLLKNEAKAEELARTALALDSTSLVALNVLGKLLFDKRAFEEGLQIYLRAARLIDKANGDGELIINPLLELAEYALSRCQFDEAKLFFESILQVFPNHSNATMSINQLKDPRTLKAYSEANNTLPLPPPYHALSVAGSTDMDSFLHGSRTQAEIFRSTFAKNGFSICKDTTLLDFGCGCGRLARHFALSGGNFFGTDYNPNLISWCRRYLPGEYSVNVSAGPLNYSDNFFECIYSYSVFTHLTEPVQIWWAKELFRVLRPGGALLLTVHGEAHLDALFPENQQLFKDGKSVVIRTDLEGQNLCASFHPEKWMRELLATAQFETVDFLPGNSYPDLSQDIYLVRKP
jgi:ubiquinone/menaquinone biosynthesis C-methylase UbiE